MVSQQKATATTDDEEIIDLTDIIEKGNVHNPKEEEVILAQMGDLGNDGSDHSAEATPEVDADIDALLAEMSDGAPAPQQNSPSDHEVNPDETLDMPGMAEVDSLLQDLDMPPQPADKSGLASNLDFVPDRGELDALLDGLGDGGLGATPTPAAAKATAAAMIEELDDLDSLLNSVAAELPPLGDTAPTEAESPETASPAATADLDDLDSLLNDISVAPAAAAAAPEAPTASADTSSMADVDDLDSLLGDDAFLSTPSAPDAPAAPATQKQDINLDVSLDDLDDLLGDHNPVMPAAPAPQEAPAPNLDLNVDDLDALLGMQDPAESTVSVPQPIPDVNELDGLDSLLTGFAEPGQEPTADTLEMLKNFDDTPMPGPVAHKPVPSLAEDLLNLDALLDTEVPKGALADALAEEAAPLPTTIVGDLDPSADLLGDLDLLLNTATLTPPSAEEMIDSVLDNAQITPESQAAGASWRAPLPETDPAESDDLLDISTEDLQRAAQELLDEKVMLEASTGDVDTGAWLNSLDEALLDTPESADAAPAADILEAAEPAPIPEAAVGTAVAAASVPAYAAAVAASSALGTLGEDERARMAELEERMLTLEEQWQVRETAQRQLVERVNTLDVHHAEHLSALEARLGSVQAETEAQITARITALEGQPASADSPASSPAGDGSLAAARLDLMEGRLMLLEEAEEKRGHAQGDNAAVSTAAASGDAAASDGASLEERLSALENLNNEAQLELEERLTTLELRFQQLDDDMRVRLEQAAAAAAAKIIREEITALLSPQ